MNSALKTHKATQSALVPKNARAVSKQKPCFADFCEPLVVVGALHARALLKVLLHYELKFKRQRSFKNAPRTLDIDLLYFSTKCHNDGFCTLPHTGVSERISVILPLGEILERKV